MKSEVPFIDLEYQFQNFPEKVKLQQENEPAIRQEIEFPNLEYIWGPKSEVSKGGG